MTKWVYQARVVPMGKPIMFPDQHGRPTTFTFDKVKRPEPAGELIYGGGLLVRRNIGHVTAVGGRALRTRQGNPIRYVGDDIVIDLPDGRQEIYCGREGRAEAIRDGVLGVR